MKKNATTMQQHTLDREKFRSKRAEAELEQARTALVNYPDDRKALLRAAAVLYRNFKTTEAIPVLTRVCELDKSDLKSRKRLAVMLSNGEPHEISTAVTMMQEIAAEHEEREEIEKAQEANDLAAEYSLAPANRNPDDTKIIAEAVGQALEIKDDYPPALIHLARIALGCDDIEEADFFYKQAFDGCITRQHDLHQLPGYDYHITDPYCDAITGLLRTRMERGNFVGAKLMAQLLIELDSGESFGGQHYLYRADIGLGYFESVIRRMQASEQPFNQKDFAICKIACEDLNTAMKHLKSYQQEQPSSLEFLSVYLKSVRELQEMRGDAPIGAPDLDVHIDARRQARGYFEAQCNIAGKHWASDPVVVRELANDEEYVAQMGRIWARTTGAAELLKQVTHQPRR